MSDPTLPQGATPTSFVDSAYANMAGGTAQISGFGLPDGIDARTLKAIGLGVGTRPNNTGRGNGGFGR